MSFLFKSPQAATPAPAPAPAPVAPAAPVVAPVAQPASTTDTKVAESERLAAERAAVIESKASGRQSTIVAGMKIARANRQDENADPLSPAKRRAAARALGE